MKANPSIPPISPPSKPRQFAWLISLVAAGSISSAAAADLLSGYTIGATSQLLTANGGAGSVLFNDAGAVGGSDVNGTGEAFYSVLLDGAGFWTVGDTVSITGFALPLVDGPTQTGTFTFDIRQGSGGTGASGTAGLASIETRTADYTTGSGTSVYYVNFDTPVTFEADANSTSIVINWVSTASIRWKKRTEPVGDALPQVNYNNGNFAGGDDTVSVSVAGSVIVAAVDSDNDGLSDLAETGGDFAGGMGTLGTYNGPGDTGTFFNNPDSDGDGIKDGDEVFGETVTGNSYTSNPTLVDSDNDSLEDGDEVNGTLNAAFSNDPTDPGDRDTDNDGLGDKFEINNGLDPGTDADFDADTYSDFDEVKLYGSDPKLDTSFPGDGSSPAVGSFTPLLDAGVLTQLDFQNAGLLGSTLIDEAGVGGNQDVNFLTGVTNHTLNFPNIFPAAGSAVSLTGFAWAVTGAVQNESGDILLEFYDPGADGVVDGIDQDTLVGTAKGTLTVTGATTIMYWTFDTPVNFTSAGTSLMVKLQSTDGLRLKAQDNFATGEWYANDGLSQFGSVRTSRVSIGGSVGSATDGIEFDSIVGGPGGATLTWTTSGSVVGVDLYRSTDLQSWGSPISTDDQDGTYIDGSAPAGAAYYLAVPTGDPAP